MQKMFLKLDGVAGDAKSLRHFGEIEISAFRWGDKAGLLYVGGAANRINDLTITKKSDKASLPLLSAWQARLNFPEGFLIVEETSWLGRLVRSTVVKMTSVLVESFSVYGPEEQIILNFESAEMMLS